MEPMRAWGLGVAVLAACGTVAKSADGAGAIDAAIDAAACGDPDGTPCTGGGLCHGRFCDSSSCFIDDAWIPAGADPANPCRACDPASPGDWTAAAAGQACAGGLCRDGECD